MDLRPLALSAGLLALVSLGACSGGSAPAEVHAAMPRGARHRDPGLADVRAAIEQGRGDLALRLLERVQGYEADLLRARALFLQGDSVGALAALESARGVDPNDPDLAGTEVEILAALDRLQAAQEKLAAAVKRFGAEPELLRAQGICELATSGHGKAALEALERARARDAGLPFVNRPLAQAHLLAGRAVLEKAPAEATAHAQAALGLWPELEDALELEAEGLAGELRFEEAIARYQELEERGRTYGDLVATLHQRCATRCLLEHDRAGAVAHYLTARKLGLDDEGLGFGAGVLAEEHRVAFGHALDAADAGDWAAAETGFAHALELAPGDLEAEDHLAVARFQQADYPGAARAWQHVLAQAAQRQVELAEPVELNLAKAWRLSGDREQARKVLSGLLDREPDGRWSEDARQLLTALEAEALAGR